MAQCLTNPIHNGQINKFFDTLENVTNEWNKIYSMFYKASCVADVKNNIHNIIKNKEVLDVKLTELRVILNFKLFEWTQRENLEPLDVYNHILKMYLSLDDVMSLYMKMNNRLTNPDDTDTDTDSDSY